MKSRTIKTLDDFVAVPEEELHACLLGFARAIREAKAAGAVIARDGGGPTGPLLPMFAWSPRASARSSAGVPNVEPETPIADLGFNYLTRAALLDERVLCLEDFSELSLSDFQKMPGVGRAAVARVLDCLSRIGLGFKAEENPTRAAIERSAALRGQPIDDRRSTVDDNAHIAELGLRTRTLTRALGKGFSTIGALRNLTPREYAVKFGSSEAREIIDALNRADLPLRCAPSPLDLWREGLLSTTDLTRPSDDATPIEHLQPWIGGAARRLKESGIDTIGAVRQRIREGAGLRVRGVGEQTQREVIEFFRSLAPSAAEE